MELPDGIQLIDKPVGITSFDVIRQLRRAYSAAHDGAKAPKMGHAGTLDPLASGLMVLGVGKGTKELTNLVKLDKEYIAEILIGESRTTGDMEGEIIREIKVKRLKEKEVTTALQDMIGTLTLPVSAYSAIKKDGVPMYKRARAAERRGQTLSNNELPIRQMMVHEAELINQSLCIINDTQRCIAKIRFKVGSGTYIRSLAEELGRRLAPPPGYPACLYSLRRTKVGEFDIKDAHQL